MHRKGSRVARLEEGIPGVERPKEEVTGEERSTLLGRARDARDALKQSAWASLGARAAAYLAGFFLLALVGSGKLLQAVPFLAGSAAPEAALLLGAPVPGAPPAGSRANVAESADGAAEGGAKGGAEEGHAAAAARDAGTPSDGGTEAGAEAGKAAATGSGVTPDGKVILNLATAEELQRLPGIGPAKSAAILALRVRLGRFRKVEDLRRVKGIGRRSLERLRPHCLVDPP
ncbi:ComEA family DNA-binding protein [Chondromyces apiculatus]|nr:ComEA family DNA-binding protein [Chondromyces apiculatus]